MSTIARKSSEGPYTVEASDGLRTQFVTCRTLCRAIRRMEHVIQDGNVCEVTILDSQENEIFAWIG